MCSTCFDVTTINKIMSKIIYNNLDLKYVLSLVQIPEQWNSFFNIATCPTPTSWSSNCITYIYKKK